MKTPLSPSRAAVALACLAVLPSLAACAVASNDPGGEVAPYTEPPSTISTFRHGRWVQHTLPALAVTPASSSSSASSGGSNPAPTPSTPAGTTGLFHGVNLSGAEFGSALPGTLNTTYTWPTNGEVDYYFGKGLETYRVPFMWERLQHAAYGAFDTTYGAALDALIAHATAKGGHVVLNPQNFARYYNNVIGSAAVPNAVFADFWSKLATRYKGNPGVIFGLMNEPHDLPTEQWVSAANAAITAIRATGATNTITVPGNAWTGAWTWYDSSYGTPNAVALLNISDPGNNVLFEVHQYLDTDGSGSVDACVNATIGSTRLAPFLKWLRANGKKGILGEFAGGRNATCDAAVKDMLTTLKANEDVMAGWLWWGAGPWWGDTYPFALDPTGGVDKPQMAVLTPFTP